MGPHARGLGVPRLIRRDLLTTPNLQWEVICLQYIHQDVKLYPSAWAIMTVNGETRTMTVGLASRLAYLVILVWSWTGFMKVLCTVNLKPGTLEPTFKGDLLKETGETSSNPDTDIEGAWDGKLDIPDKKAGPVHQHGEDPPNRGADFG